MPSSLLRLSCAAPSGRPTLYGANRYGERVNGDRRDHPGTQEPTLLPVERWAAATTLAAQVAFLALLVALHLLRPDLDPSWRLVSEYVGGRFGALMVAAFALSALGCLAVVVAGGRRLGSAAGAAGAFVLIVSAVALGVAAIYPTDPIFTAPEQLTRAGRIHLAGAGVSMVSFPIAALLIAVALSSAPRYRATRRWMWIVTGATWVALAALAVPLAGALESGFGPDVAIGWPHRALLLADSVWLLLVAVRALGAGRRG
jgi:MFS family permease